MTKEHLLGGTSATASAAVAGDFTPEPAPPFEAPTPPAESADFPTIHAHLAETMRRVVAIDDAGYAELFNAGQILPPETRATTEAMRGALAMYERAAALAKDAPISVMLRQALAHLAAASTVPADDDPELRSAYLNEARARIETSVLALDFQAQPESTIADLLKNEELRASVAHGCFQRQEKSNSLEQVRQSVDVVLDLTAARAALSLRPPAPVADVVV